MRFGLHSGPVTAGVLKGDRARFQLFGDTVNTAARMESTGVMNKIQVSATTAELLKQAGKQHWTRARDDSVHAKGKGVLSTYWLDFASKKSRDSVSNMSASDASSHSARAMQEIEEKKQMKRDRLVDWIVEIFLDDIKKIVSSKGATALFF